MSKCVYAVHLFRSERTQCKLPGKLDYFRVKVQICAALERACVLTRPLNTEHFALWTCRASVSRVSQGTSFSLVEAEKDFLSAGAADADDPDNAPPPKAVVSSAAPLNKPKPVRVESQPRALNP